MIARSSCLVRLAQVAQVVGVMLGVGNSWSASDGLRVQVTPTTAELRPDNTAVVQITVSSSVNETYCGMSVDFGDGEQQDVKIEDRQDRGLFPRRFQHTYRTLGAFVVHVRGKRVTTHNPCEGEAKASISIVDSASRKAAQLRERADKGDVEAINELARGLAHEKQYSNAVEWYRRAAEAGDPVATYNLGYLYDKGLGVPTNHEQAFRHYQRAADLGEPAAMNGLGLMYASGRASSREPDLIQAYAWFSLAAAKAQDDQLRGQASGNRDKIASRLSQKDLRKAQDLSLELSKKGSHY